MGTINPHMTNTNGWPVSAWVKCKRTGAIGQIQSPYTCAGEYIIRAGRVIVSNFGEYGVAPDSIEPLEAERIPA